MFRVTRRPVLFERACKKCGDERALHILFDFYCPDQFVFCTQQCLCCGKRKRMMFPTDILEAFVEWRKIAEDMFYSRMALYPYSRTKFIVPTSVTFV